LGRRAGSDDSFRLSARHARVDGAHFGENLTDVASRAELPQNR
jgi:hypothetical protein